MTNKYNAIRHYVNTHKKKQTSGNKHLKRDSMFFFHTSKLPCPKKHFRMLFLRILFFWIDLEQTKPHWKPLRQWPTNCCCIQNKNTNVTTGDAQRFHISSFNLKVGIWDDSYNFCMYRSLGVIPGYTAVNGCMASDWHPRTKILTK